MPASNPLRTGALKTVKFLTESKLLTDEHAATVALLEALCDEYPLATNSTQRSAISREIRNCLESLPKPEAKVSDEAADFLADLESA